MTLAWRHVQSCFVAGMLGQLVVLTGAVQDLYAWDEQGPRVPFKGPDGVSGTPQGVASVQCRFCRAELSVLQEAT